MPLVHRFSGPAFAPSPAKAKAVNDTRLSALTLPAGPLEGVAHDPDRCPQCDARLPVFDLSRRCCVDRYEALFGSAREHRDVIARAIRAALLGDVRPAHRLIESYRRVFGPMEAAELRRRLLRGVAELRSHGSLASAA